MEAGSVREDKIKNLALGGQKNRVWHFYFKPIYLQLE